VHDKVDAAKKKKGECPRYTKNTICKYLRSASTAQHSGAEAMTIYSDMKQACY
jgi:hypothetical protein